MENKAFCTPFYDSFSRASPPFRRACRRGPRPPPFTETKEWWGGEVASVPHPLIGACWYNMRVDERESMLLQKGHVRFVLSPVERSRLSHRSVHAKWTGLPQHGVYPHPPSGSYGSARLRGAPTKANPPDIPPPLSSGYHFTHLIREVQ
jgi:hypothetical protein